MRACKAFEPPCNSDKLVLQMASKSQMLPTASLHFYRHVLVLPDAYSTKWSIPIDQLWLWLKATDMFCVSSLPKEGRDSGANSDHRWRIKAGHDITTQRHRKIVDDSLDLNQSYAMSVWTGE